MDGWNVFWGDGFIDFFGWRDVLFFWRDGFIDFWMFVFFDLFH